MHVTIITPSFNQGRFLEQTILSVLNQTYRHIQFLVIDGGSTDNSVDIIRKYEQRIQFWVSEPDGGQADAINKGFALAKGDLICWVNSDDILYPNYVADRVAQFKDNPSMDMIYGDVDEGPDMTSKTIRKGRQTDVGEMLKNASCPVPQQSAMWRRSVIEQMGYLNPRWHVILDREYFTRIAAKGRMKYIAGSVALFRTHAASKSVAEKLKWGDEMPQYYEMIFRDNIYGLAPEILARGNQCLSKIYFKSGRMFARAGQKQLAADFYLKSKRASLYTYIRHRYF